MGQPDKADLPVAHIRITSERNKSNVEIHAKYFLLYRKYIYKGIIRYLF